VSGSLDLPLIASGKVRDIYELPPSAQGGD
jgi:hypothetical protein